jgi:DNA-binding GntR family transcriptional regulator
MRPRASQIVREKITDEIASGRLPPGSRIDEQALAAQFKVSRTPAREALLQLASAGLITFLPRQGAVVAEFSAQDVVSMLELLIALEGEAARLAARRMTVEDRARLAALQVDARPIVAQRSTPKYEAYNEAFHGMIYAAARNSFLTDQVKALRQRLAPYLLLAFVQQDRAPNSWSEHGEIAEAIIRSDEAAARDAMIKHITAGGSIFADSVAFARRPTKLSGSV